MLCTIRVGRWVRCDDPYFSTIFYAITTAKRPWNLTRMLSWCLLRSFCSLNWQGRNQRHYPYFRVMNFGQKIKQFALGDPEKQLVSREYLTDLLHPSQTPQPHKLFLKLFSHLAMHYKLEVIGQGEEKEWRPREISSISASCLHTAKEREKAFPIFDFQIIVWLPLFFQEHLSFLPPSRLHLSLLSFSIWFTHGCVATACSLKKRLARYKRLNEKVSCTRS